MEKSRGKKKPQQTSHVVLKVERERYDRQFMETKGNFKYTKAILISLAMVNSPIPVSSGLT